MADQPHVAVLVLRRGPRRRAAASSSGCASGGHELTLAQARLAARIGPDGTRLTELAESAQVTKQTAGALVDQLERAGYVERVVRPDRRARAARCGSLRGARRRWPSRGGSRPSWRPSGARTSATRRTTQLETTMARLREVTDPWWSPATVC